MDEEIAVQQDSPAEIQQEEPAGAESADDAGSITEEQQPPARAKVWTVAEVIEEYFPGATQVSGGVLAGVQREVRRRNRKAEKGY